MLSIYWLPSIPIQYHGYRRILLIIWPITSEILLYQSTLEIFYDMCVEPEPYSLWSIFQWHPVLIIYNIPSSTFLNDTTGRPIVSTGFSAGSMFFTSFHRSPGSVISLEGVSSFYKHQSLIKYKNIRAISLSVKQKHQVCIFGVGSKSITTRHRDKFAHYKTQIQKNPYTSGTWLHNSYF